LITGLKGGKQRGSTIERGSYCVDKGKPVERQGRKAIGPFQKRDGSLAADYLKNQKKESEVERMKTKILMSVLAIGMAIALIGGATMAWFTDEAETEANTFAAGTLDLKAYGEDKAVSVSLSNMAPGETSGYYKWVLRNDGSLPGKLSVSFSEMENKTNLMNAPKEAALKEYYGDEFQQWIGNGQEGHLGWFLKPEMGFSSVGGEKISRIQSIWTTGPENPWGTPGLNGFGGNTYGTDSFLEDDILEPGEEVQFMLIVSLDDNLRIHTGTEWIEAPDNMIQGDSVEFDITFSLEQVHD
jgi:predicted ribosomally synthesized peptide with SipW-like signal peptide